MGTAVSGMRVFFHRRLIVQNDCRLWARSIASEWRPDIVVFLAKSGFLFAEPIADELGCPLVEVCASRPDNGAKDAVRDRVAWLPRWALALALSAKSGYVRHERDSRRDVRPGASLSAIDLCEYQHILLVDDSVDTGWSMAGAVKLLQEMAPESEIRVASYCVVGGSESRVKCDYRRYDDAIVMTATSRFSPEYKRFLDDYKQWRATIS